MRGLANKLALLAVAASILSSCTGRRILHGMHGHALPVARAPVTTDHLNIWFVEAQANGLKVVPVARKPASGDKLELAVRELLNGPSSDEEHHGLGTEIPRGTLLLDVKRTGNNVELNLSRRFALDGGTTSFETRLEQLRKTVAQVAGQADVYLSVEGKRLNIEEGEGIEIPQPINR